MGGRSENFSNNFSFNGEYILGHVKSAPIITTDIHVIPLVSGRKVIHDVIFFNPDGGSFYYQGTPLTKSFWIKQGDDFTGDTIFDGTHFTIETHAPLSFKMFSERTGLPVDNQVDMYKGNLVTSLDNLSFKHDVATWSSGTNCDIIVIGDLIP